MTEVDRFSPACAGNTHVFHDQLERRSVQPRVCGEHIKERLPLDYGHGSAPRVRGTLVLGHQVSL